MTDVLPHEANFTAIGTRCSVVVTDPSALLPAVSIARDELNALDAAASRFRADSELSRINALAEFGELTSPISPLLQDYLNAALRVARLTQGLVDPTVGQAIIAAGYDDDIDRVRGTRRRSLPTAPAPGWQELALTNESLRLPRRCVIDLGASAKAHAADRIVARLRRFLPGGFLVDLGGDIAVAGLGPEGGWHIGVEAADGARLQSIRVRDAGVATSSTTLRSWITDAGAAHHIIDPRTGRVAVPAWSQVSVVADTSLEANAWSTAAIVLGDVAPDWLEARNVIARLDHADGVRFTGAWPREAVLAA